MYDWRGRGRWLCHDKRLDVESAEEIAFGHAQRPNGALGTWMTKRSNSVLGGRPVALMWRSSTGPSGVSMTRAFTFLTQLPAIAAAERTISNLSGLAALAGVAAAVARTMAPMNGAAYRHDSLFNVLIG